MFFAAVMLKTRLLGWMLSIAIIPWSILLRRIIISFRYDNSSSFSQDSDQALITLIFSVLLILHLEIAVLRVKSVAV